MADANFVTAVTGHLRRHDLDVYLCLEDKSTGISLRGTNISEICDRDGFLCFVGESCSSHQLDEAREAHRYHLLEGPPQPADYYSLAVFIGGQEKDSDLPPDIRTELSWLFSRSTYLPDNFTRHDPPRITECARQIVSEFGIVWKESHGLPANPNMFSYEKDVIRFFLDIPKLNASPPLPPCRIEFIRKALADGAPFAWPKVSEIRRHGAPSVRPNTLEEGEIGAFRDPEAQVAAAALTRFKTSDDEYATFNFSEFTFPEAGPRRQHLFPADDTRGVRAGILVSGGIAPGINVVVDAIVRRHELYADRTGVRHECFGLINGFYSFKDLNVFFRPLSHRAGPQWLPGTLATSEWSNKGGSILGTSRVDELLSDEHRQAQLENMVQQLLDRHIDILYVIGGDGSMKAAHALWQAAQAERFRVQGAISIVAIPKTMDNDILWSWQSFGFLSAVQSAKEIVEHLSTEVRSNPRVCVVQLFGSVSGFVVSHAVLASSGRCDLALIPELDFSVVGIAKHLNRRIYENASPIPAAVVVMAETAIPTDVRACLGDYEATDPYRDLYKRITEDLRDNRTLTKKEEEALRRFDHLRSEGRNIEGQTDDDLRRAGLKIVMESLRLLLPTIHSWPYGKGAQGGVHWDRLRMLSNEPRHLIRAIPPSTADFTLGDRLGLMAVDNAMAGYTDCMVSQWLTEFVLIPLELVVLGRKRVPATGNFWRSLLAKTGQPTNLVEPASEE